MENLFSQTFKVLSNQDRILMLRLLAKSNGKLTPSEVGDQFYLEQPTISHHLHSLQRIGIVQNHGKTGRCIYYSANLGFLESLLGDFKNFITN